MDLSMSLSMGSSNSNRHRLPTFGLLAAWLEPNLTDTIGESVIVFASGSSLDLMTAVFSFESSVTTLQLDTLEGGNVFFDSSNAMAPIVRTGFQWRMLLNTSFVWIGKKGIAGYSTDQNAIADKIMRFLDQPLIPTLHADFTSVVFWWGGASKTLGDLTVVEAGGYSLNYNLGFAGTAIVVLDIEYNQANPPSGFIFSWTSGYPSGNRVEWDVTSGSLDKGYRVYLPSPTTPTYQALLATSKAGEVTGWYAGNGRHRIITRIKNSEIVRFQPDNGDYRAGDKTAGSLVAPTKIGFGCRAWASGTPDGQLIGGVLHAVTIYTSDDAPIELLGQSGVARPVHLIGDSFLNLYKIYVKLIDLTSPLGYIGYSQDGVGSTSLQQQAARFNLTTKWHDSTLVICDFGFTDTTADAIAAIESMVANLTHARWVVMEPAPSEADGTGSRPDWDQRVSELRTYYGARFVDTLSVALANGDASIEDDAEIAKRLWPLSLRLSLGDFHPNAAGDTLIATIIRDAMVARDYI